MKRLKKHYDRLSAIGCILCRETLSTSSPAEMHHIGSSSERDDWLVIPLCPEHHRGATGFHGLGEREFNRRYKTSEIELLARTLEAIHA